MTAVQIGIALGKDPLWVSRSHYTPEDAVSQIAGIKHKLKSEAGVLLLSNQIGKELEIGLDYTVGVIKR